MTEIRTALVTGANRGIGAAIAAGLAARGDIKVLTAARTAQSAEEAARSVGGIAVTLDLTDPNTVFDAAQAIEAEHGPIDILVNNAAILTEGAVDQISVEELQASLAVNTASPFALIRALGPGMKARGWGRIVNVSSGWGSFAEGLTGPAAYSISKASLNAMTLTAAQALGNAVKVNAACPGWVRTRMGGSAATNSPEEGADTPIWLATLPDNGPTGGFFRNRRSIDW